MALSYGVNPFALFHVKALGFLSKCFIVSNWCMNISVLGVSDRHYINPCLGKIIISGNKKDLVSKSCISSLNHSHSLTLLKLPTWICAIKLKIVTLLLSHLLDLHLQK